MKKYVFIFLLLVGCTMPFFAQNENKNDSNAELIVSLLDQNILLHAVEYFPKESYVTPSGQKITQKEATKILLSSPDSIPYVKQYKRWKTATFVLLGICCASVTTELVYTFNDNLPYADTVNTITSLATPITLAGALFTSELASSRYDIALEQYNLSLLELKE